MNVKLPDAVAAFFEADRRNGDAVAHCFTPLGIVVDEGITYEAHASIAAWRNNAATQYEYTVDPFQVTIAGEKIIVTSHVAGTFPGSPVDLTYTFVLSGDKIAHLEITL